MVNGSFLPGALGRCLMGYLYGTSVRIFPPQSERKRGTSEGAWGRSAPKLTIEIQTDGESQTTQDNLDANRRDRI